MARGAAWTWMVLGCLAQSACGAEPVGQADPAARAGTAAPQIHVKGAHLVDAAGNTVQLRGVNISGLEFVAIQGWSPSSPWGGAGAPRWNALKTWKINVVRLPLNEASWLGYPCVRLGEPGSKGRNFNPDPGGNYRATVADAVEAATRAGLYVILDLHTTAPGNNCPMTQNPMADADHSPAFWSQVAGEFKNYPNVIFEAFNEPYLYWLQAPASPWKVLRDGGTETQFAAGGTPYQVALDWQVAGTQQLVDAIRATGARNVILTAGIAWAADLSQWLTYMPKDPLGQLGAAWHAYPTFGAKWGTAAYAQPNLAPAIWGQVQEILGADVPVVITEFGDRNAPGTSGAPFAANLLPWADKNGVGYLGWTWGAWQNPDFVLLKDLDGTPTDGYGAYVKSHYICVAAGKSDCP